MGDLPKPPMAASSIHLGTVQPPAAVCRRLGRPLQGLGYGGHHLDRLDDGREHVSHSRAGDHNQGQGTDAA